MFDEVTEIASELMKTLHCCLNANIIHKEWDQRCSGWKCDTNVWNYTWPLRGRRWIEVLSKIASNRQSLEMKRKFLARVDTKMLRIPTLCSFSKENLFETTQNSHFRMETELTSPCLNIGSSGNVTSNSLHFSSNGCHCLQITCNMLEQEWIGWVYTWSFCVEEIIKGTSH